ncbi:MAG: hypothetical protein IPJ85_03475 [Flavobacteriales bacterium]|nr:hypothetical protein [Flavobacteriales bacterium]
MLRLVDKGRIEVEQLEFHPGGALRSKGLARYNRSRMDTQRIGHMDLFRFFGSGVAPRGLHRWPGARCALKPHQFLK